jgi:Domain of unknown function (DUF4189)
MEAHMSAGGIEGNFTAWYMNRSFGAIAYSATTGRYDGSWNCGSYADACHAALSRCGHGAQIVAHCQNGYLALALGSAGCGADYNVNKRHARRNALKKAGRHARIVILLHSYRGIEEQIPPTDPPVTVKSYQELYGWGAISYSPKTGLYSFSFRNTSAESAAQAAVDNCNRQSDDAVVLIAGCNTFLALARCEGGFGAGGDYYAAQAEQIALHNCSAHGSRPRIVLLLHTHEGPAKMA